MKSVKKIIISVLLMCPVSAFAEELNCGYVKYKVERGLLRSDQVFEVFDRSIEWSKFCDGGSASEKSFKYPVYSCSSVSEYLFKTVFVAESDWYTDKDGSETQTGRIELQWADASDSPETWSVYDQKHSFPKPFDVKKIQKYFQTYKGIPNFDTDLTWQTTVQNTQIVNFDLKRVQFRTEYLSKSISGINYEDKKVNTLDCE